MTRKGWITAAGALNLAVLVATSPPRYEASDTAEPVEIELSPEQPEIYIRGEVSGGSAVDYVTLSLSFEGTNEASASGRVVLLEVPEEAEPIPEVPSVVIEARSGQPQPVTFTLAHNRQRDQFGPFELALQLEGEAVLLGALTVSAHTTSDEEEDGFTVQLSDIEVAP
jgi:hypothetical protein